MNSAHPRTASGVGPSFAAVLRDGHPVLSGYTVALLVVLPALLIASAIDSRELLGHGIWVKPIKFDLAIAVYLITLSVYAHLMAPSWRESTRFNRYVAVIGTTVVFEMAWLIYAAAIGEPSHFNQSHPLLQPVYFAMGVLALLLTSLSAVIGVGVLKHNTDTINPLLRYAVGYSLLATTLLTAITASYLSSAPAQSHAVLPDGMGALNRDAAVPLLGWLRDAGDLRVAHFFSTHALHVIPLMAAVLVWVLPRRLSRSRRTAHAVAAALTLGFAGFVLYVFRQALAGVPFF